MRYRVPWSILFLALIGLTTPRVWAQATATATLQGTITDATGAVIPSVEVKITNKSTGETRTAISNGTGVYLFNLLPAGMYDLRASIPGFSTAGFDDVE